MYKYSVIPSNEIPTEYQKKAYEALSFARKDLHLPDIVRIKWFRNALYVKGECEETFETDNLVYGMFFGKHPESIYLNAILTEPGQDSSIWETTLHETFHLFQLRIVSINHSETESNADGYAKDALNRMKEAERSGELEKIYLDGLCGKDWSNDKKPEQESVKETVKPENKNPVREELIKKSKSFNLKSVDIKAAPDSLQDSSEISLINQYTLEDLQPEDVFTFSLVLCDNEVDRDNERFTESALVELARLIRGKTGIFDHNWSAKNQTARIYDTSIVTVSGRKNSLGCPLQQLKAKAYMLDDYANRDLIRAIKGGIIKEVSVGFAVKKCKCSVCGKTMYRHGVCERGHTKGCIENGVLCVGELSEIKDAYEFSFVAVPAQPAAGVSK